MIALLPLAVFLSAAAALAVEIAIVRLGAPYVGQSLLPWTAAIASVLLGLTFGHLLGGMAGGRSADAARLWRHLGLAWLAAGCGALAMPGLATRLASALVDAQAETLPIVAVLALLAFLPSLAVGFTTPLALRVIIAADAGHLPRRIAAIYAASAAGSVFGTALAGFVLLERIGAAGLGWLVGGLWLVLGAAALLAAGASQERRLAAAAAIALMSASVLLDPVRPPCLVETRYTCIRLFDRALGDSGVVRFMVLDEGVHSASDRDDPARLHLGYAGMAGRLAREVFGRTEGATAFTIGGGGNTLARAWASGAPPVAVTVAELDAEVAAQAASAMWATPGPGLTTIVGDGRAVLRSLPAGIAYDVVLMDAYRTHSVPPHLVTREFGEGVLRRLRPGGAYLSNVIDRSETLYLSRAIASTLGEIFPAVDIWVPDRSGEVHTNAIVAAWRDAGTAFRPDTLTIEATILDEGAEPRSVPVVWRRIDAASPEGGWPAPCRVVLTDDWAPVDRLLAGRSPCAK